MLQAVWLARAAWHTRRIIRRGERVNHPQLEAALHELAAGLKLRRTPGLWQTDELSGPALVGLWRPLILIPPAWLNRLDEDAWRAVLRHELLHVRRHDLAAAWLLTIARVVHWFNPLAWLAEYLGQREIEFACDEAVLAHGETPFLYGQTLLRLAQAIPPKRLAVPSLGIMRGKRTLRHRLARIGGYVMPGWGRWGVSAALFVIVVAAFGADEQPLPPRPPVAGSASPGEKPADPPVKEEPSPAAQALPEWAKGWSVQSIAIPSSGRFDQAYVKLRTASGRDLTFTEGEIGNDSVTLIKVDWVGSPVRARVVLGRQAERAELFADASQVSRDDTLKARPPEVEIEARFIELARDTWLAQSKKWFQSVSASLPSPDPFDEKAVLTGVFTAAQADGFLRAVNATKGVDLVSAPRVTTRSQQRAVIEIIREFRYPTEWEPPNEKFDHWSPTAFETQNVGASLDVEPVLNVDGVLDLSVTPKVVEFLGFVETAPGKPSRSAQSKPKVKSKGNSPLMDRALNPGVAGQTFERPKPIFHTRSSTVSVTIFLGQTIVLLLPNPDDTAPFPNPSANRCLVVLITASRPPRP